MNVLSLFDGMSCGMLALDKAGIPVNNYYASEIDKYTIQVSKANYPNIQQVGDVRHLKGPMFPKIDLLIGGSPCQGFSFAGKQLNFNDPRSALFFEYARILKECRPRYFLLENVKMKKEYQDIISTLLGVEPIEINSALVSAQNRRRLYWTNIPGVTQPPDQGILLRDIIEDGVVDRDKSLCIKSNYSKGGNPDIYRSKKHNQLVFSVKGGAFRGRYKVKCAGLTSQELEVRQDDKTNAVTTVQKDTVLVFSKDGLCHIGNADLKGNDSNKRVYHPDGKAPTLLTCSGGHQEPKVAVFEKPHGFVKGGYSEKEKFSTLRVATSCNYKVRDGLYWRKLTPVEGERLQTVPDNYTDYVSNSQRYKMLGNGWTIDVISHIFKNLAGS